MEYLGVGWSWGSLLLEKLIVDWQFLYWGGEFDEVLEFYPCGLRLSGLRVLLSQFFSKNMGSSVFQDFFVYFCHTVFLLRSM